MEGTLVITLAERRVYDAILLIEDDASANEPVANLEDTRISRQSQKIRFQRHWRADRVVLVEGAQARLAILLV